MQIRCAYCNKKIHQAEERRYGKITLCPQCFEFLGLGFAQANSIANSKELSKEKIPSVSKRRSRTFTIGLSLENPQISERKSLRFLKPILKDVLKDLRGD